jgi:4-methylaminobutanoate oxidase (formaldehyde-forming)
VLDDRGGYEADVTVTRLAHDEYLWVTSSGAVLRDLDHITKQTPRDAHAVAVDVTSSYAVFGVMGPASRALLQGMSRTDLSHEAFPFATSREIDLGPYTVRATRITYVGELGWELYVPVEFAVGVHELLTAAGTEHGLADAGYYAINSLRLEKGYRAIGSDLTAEYNPVEAGLLFACKLKKDIPFRGREAVEAARAEGPRRRLVSFVLDDPEPMMWGGELVLRDGVAVGQVTSAAWGATLGACVGLAYIHHPDGAPVTRDFLTSGTYETDIGAELHPATVHLRAPYDPGFSRVRR